MKAAPETNRILSKIKPCDEDVKLGIYSVMNTTNL